MKKNIHPKYRTVLFVDSATGYKFLCGSALETEEREVFEGKEYPVHRMSVSSSSHPFFTGSKALVDAEGRVDKFRKRYSGEQNKAKAAAPAPVKEATKKKAPAQKRK